MFTLVRELGRVTANMASYVLEATISACQIIATEITKNHILTFSKKKRKRRWWTRKWIMGRNVTGASALIQNELSSKYTEDFQNLLRMSEDHFNFLLEAVSPYIQKSDTRMREAIPARIKLEVTLRYLATGDSFKSLEYLFKVPASTISKFLPDVLDNIYTCLHKFIEVRKELFGILYIFIYTYPHIQ